MIILAVRAVFVVLARVFPYRAAMGEGRADPVRLLHKLSFVTCCAAVPLLGTRFFSRCSCNNAPVSCRCLLGFSPLQGGGRLLLYDGRVSDGCRSCRWHAVRSDSGQALDRRRWPRALPRCFVVSFPTRARETSCWRGMISFVIARGCSSPRRPQAGVSRRWTRARQPRGLCASTFPRSRQPHRSAE